MITLIQENARLAHLLRTKTAEKAEAEKAEAEKAEAEKAMAERSARSWPASDGDSRGLDYFAPSLKVFSEMLDHDLRAAAERSLDAFSVRA